MSAVLRSRVARLQARRRDLALGLCRACREDEESGLPLAGWGHMVNSDWVHVGPCINDARHSPDWGALATITKAET